MELAFGPVPSRRLGRSLGMNNIPPKHCTYACVYCQLGRTPDMGIERRAFHDPEAIAAAVGERVDALRRRGERLDYLTFVPDGEPTLDARLGDSIERLRPLGVPIAVISNASLVGRRDVRDDLARADWVSLKVDAVDTETWRRIDRPHGGLDLAAILDGIHAFAAAFRGRLVTETMLVEGLNDGDDALQSVAAFLGTVAPETAYIAVPTRPPAEPWVRAPDEARVQRAHHWFSERVSGVELLIGYEGDAFSSTGDPVRDLLGITAVHPMRREAVERLLAESGATWDVVEGLMRAGELVEVGFGDAAYYLRRIRRHGEP